MMLWEENLSFGILGNMNKVDKASKSQFDK